MAKPQKRKGNLMVSLLRRYILVLVSVVALTVPSISFAERVRENPGSGKMTADLLLARPIGLAFLGIGTGVYLVTLPLSLLGGNAGDAGNKLVMDPAKEVFVRCLGCSRVGRKEKIAETQ